MAVVLGNFNFILLPFYRAVHFANFEGILGYPVLSII